jgi:prolyl-tRNA editing enzyme YbaK/EbsC (Cys-tRNA(Pro) deacylase)
LRLRRSSEQPNVSIESVRAFLAEKAPDIAIIELPTSTATVALAAAAHGVGPERIAKTLSLRVGGRNLLLVVRGDARLDNRKMKAFFGGKAKLLETDEVQAITGHPVGGVCPFGLKSPLPIYCDISIRAFDEIVPAAGSTQSALRINPLRMAELVDAEWVDVTPN